LSTITYLISHPASDCPPTFILQAGDDPTDDVRHSMTYYLALPQAGIPAELHL
jgi:acetyl esterase/lipase